jgi:hypothetical protein
MNSEQLEPIVEGVKHMRSRTARLASAVVVLFVAGGIAAYVLASRAEDAQNVARASRAIVASACDCQDIEFHSKSWWLGLAYFQDNGRENAQLLSLSAETYGDPIYVHVWVVDDIREGARGFVSGGIISNRYPSIWTTQRRHKPSHLNLVFPHEYSIAMNMIVAPGTRFGGFSKLSAVFDVGGTMISKTFQLSAYECGNRPAMSAASCGRLADSLVRSSAGHWVELR